MRLFRNNSNGKKMYLKAAGEVVSSGGAGVWRFVVLIPHRDSLLPLRDFRRRLFALGFAGAYAFPPVIPLARVSRPLNQRELEALARSLREAALTANPGGKGRLSLGRAAAAPGPEGLRFWGPCLDLPAWAFPAFEGAVVEAVTGEAAEAVTGEAAPEEAAGAGPVLCAALLDEGDAGRELPPCPALGFRAAAAANLILRPLPSGAAGGSFSWETGQPRWLPR
jgi:hypothetical protein